MGGEGFRDGELFGVFATEGGEFTGNTIEVGLCICELVTRFGQGGIGGVVVGFGVGGGDFGGSEGRLQTGEPVFEFGDGRGVGLGVFFRGAEGASGGA